MSKKFIYVFIGLIGFAFLATGCNNYTESENNSIITMGRSPKEKLEISDLERENNIKKAVCCIESVENVWVIASGDNIVIGIETYEQNDDNIQRIKFEAKDKAESVDKWADNVSVTTNPNIVEMIKNV
ncbi:hypothetical protein B5E58_08570 [Tyzzerella sp. An114]|uniref:YhcN/YlaJ family sporulation lipoprotein n=1 Tax=Tyzzerella sp. An114 TaxID=1965545 RepID=UPI000B4392AA|nr:YhcN/YlaJ family sporulation lipoprotein [Tyzzerella sp. An114]OUQ57995.1 hypothetical protein B5E58_08570 [Tyzzerella sp. An114]